MSLVAASRTSQLATRVAARRMSTTPKLHKAKDQWSEFVKTRPPPDHLDEHKCFHPPFNAAVIGGGIIVAWVIGYGSMAFGMAHQQKKQGFWK
ncbi:hypothetical protein IV203_008391 [Nitzschia inconspicua]|uniref:Uncharacterized protein n=1 Tax=Nitzschia inconspicua TaxID=303405 RepID=A0A9K3KYM3_9STRA|nr:hypothetical protein IV203_008391 [Nitzschia inconspicua]